jgi:uncharacterized Zn finger protein
MAFYRQWAPYVSVTQRRAEAAREIKKLGKIGRELKPVRIESRTIAKSFWGASWCENLERYADWSNRMPRGRTYARNGSILDLQIESGEITALVSGSSLYKVEIKIGKVAEGRWKQIREECARQVTSLIDLMRGRLPEGVLKRLSDRKTGLFPEPKELKVKCSCPDYAYMCKHAAAVLYGVGHRLDDHPELFFTMRCVDQSELVSDAITTQKDDDTLGIEGEAAFDSEELESIFGIDLVKPSRKAKVGKKGGSEKGQSEKVKSGVNGTAKGEEAKRVKVKSAGVKAAKVKAVKVKAAKVKAVKVKAAKVKSVKVKAASVKTGKVVAKKAKGAGVATVKGGAKGKRAKASSRGKKATR